MGSTWGPSGPRNLAIWEGRELGPLVQEDHFIEQNFRTAWHATCKQVSHQNKAELGHLSDATSLPEPKLTIPCGIMSHGEFPVAYTLILPRPGDPGEGRLLHAGVYVDPLQVGR